MRHNVCLCDSADESSETNSEDFIRWGGNNHIWVLASEMFELLLIKPMSRAAVEQRIFSDLFLSSHVSLSPYEPLCVPSPVPVTRNEKPSKVVAPMKHARKEPSVWDLLEDTITGQWRGDTPHPLELYSRQRRPEVLILILVKYARCRINFVKPTFHVKTANIRVIKPVRMPGQTKPAKRAKPQPVPGGVKPPVFFLERSFQKITQNSFFGKKSPEKNWKV